MPDLIPDREGFVSEDGHRIHYEYFGGGDRDPICLLNGLAMHTKAWYGFLPRLLPELDVILYDYPGQGTSSADDVPYFIPRIAAYLARRTPKGRSGSATTTPHSSPTAMVPLSAPRLAT